MPVPAVAPAPPSAVAVPSPPAGTPPIARPPPTATAASDQRSQVVAPPAASAATTGSGPLRLLLVDDSAVVRAKLRKLFEPLGYSLVLARDGREALAILADTACALMITDLEMPELDGFGLIGALQAQPGAPGRPAMPILAITGHDNLQERLAQLPAIQGIYRKPWQDDELLQRVRSLIGRPNTMALH